MHTALRGGRTYFRRDLCLPQGRRNARNLVTDEEIYDSKGSYAYTLHKEYNNSDQVILETNPLGMTLMAH